MNRDMIRHLGRIAGILLLLAGGLVHAPAVRAQPTQGKVDRNQDFANLPSQRQGHPQILVSQSHPFGVAPLASYMIELAAPPAAVIYAGLARGDLVSSAAAVAAAQGHLAAIEAAQQATATWLAGHDVPVLYRTQRVYNGIAVRAHPAQVATLATLPGVKAIHRILAARPDNATSVPYLDAPLLWGGVAGAPPALGTGMRIAIIDTGIDYLHADFGGPASSDAYAANDPAISGDVPGFPNIKIVGGYDFAGDRYNADPDSLHYNPVPQPDPDPMDCYGHGTHVAGTAAGFGVTGDSAPYNGPYTATANLGALRIGPGVAPLAELYALKVFGCAGSSDLVPQAIEWAVDPDGDGDFADRVDVINLSLGSPYGELYDPTSVAANNAAQLGVVVVASAGNSGDDFFALGSPSNADRVISVAAIQHGQTTLPHGDVQRVEFAAGFSSRGPRAGDAGLKPDLAAPGVGIASASSLTGSAARTLSGTSMAAPHVAGAMALLRELRPDWTVEELKALVMNTAYPLVRTGIALTSTLYAPGRVGAGRIDLRMAVKSDSVAYNAQQPGRVALPFGAPAVVDHFTAAQNVRIVNKGALARTFELSYFPITDLTGVTVTVPAKPLQVLAGTLTEFPVLLAVNAGELQRRLDPALSVYPVFGRHWLDEESGHVLMWPQGANWQATLGDAGDSAIFAYSPATAQLAYTITLVAVAPADVLTITLGAGRPGDSLVPLYTLYRATDGALPATLSGTISFDPAYELLLAADGLAVGVATVTQPASEVRGQLAVQTPVLHLPLHAAPRAVSAMSADRQQIDFGSDAGATPVFALTGQPMAPGATPTKPLALASVFQLEWQSANTRPPGLPEQEPDSFDSADISHVGIATDFPVQAPGSAMLYFGIAAHAPWSSPNTVRFDVFLDVNGDGIEDYRLFNSSRDGYLHDFLHSDSFVSALENLRTHSITAQGPLNGLSVAEGDSRPYLSRILVLPVRVADLQIPTGRTTIDYQIKSYHLYLGDQPEQIIDVLSTRRFDLAHPALDLLGGRPGVPSVPDQPGHTFTARLDLLGYGTAQPGGVLLLHHHNQPDAQVEVLELGYRWPSTLLLPYLAR